MRSKTFGKYLLAAGLTCMAGGATTCARSNRALEEIRTLPIIEKYKSMESELNGIISSDWQGAKKGTASFDSKMNTLEEKIANMNDFASSEEYKLARSQQQFKSETRSKEENSFITGTIVLLAGAFATYLASEIITTKKNFISWSCKKEIQ